MGYPPPTGTAGYYYGGISTFGAGGTGVFFTQEHSGGLVYGLIATKIYGGISTVGPGGTGVFYPGAWVAV